MFPSCLSEDDCKVVLRKYFGDEFFNILNVSLKPYSKDVNGFLGDHMLLKIQLERENRTMEVKFFVKCLQTANEAFLNLAVSSNSFGKEIFIYTDFAEAARKILPRVEFDFLPKFLFASNGLIVLEDLSENGYVLKGDNTEITHVELALRKLAKFHCISLGIEEYQSRKNAAPYKLTDDYKEILKEGLFRRDEHFIGHKLDLTSIKALLHLMEYLPIHRISTESFRKKFEEEIQRFYAIFNEENSFRKVCCHGDLWRNNLLFKHEKDHPIDCLIVDFQLHRYAPPAHDVTFLIYQITNKKLFRKHYQDFLKAYYQYLTEELLKINLEIANVLPLEEYEETCKLFLLPAKIIKTFYCTLNAASQEACKRIMGDSETSQDFLFVDRRPYCKEFFETEPNYREMMTNLLENIRAGIFYKILSIEDCYHILNQILDYDYEIVDYLLQPITSKIGFIGDYQKLAIYTKTGENQFNFFVKQASKIPQVLDFATSMGVMVKEHSFYTKILPFFQKHNVDLMQASAPKCYLFRLNSLSVFEDLNSEGYQMLDSRIPLDYDLVVATLKKMAGFHAATLILEEEVGQQLGNKFSLFDEFHQEFALKKDVPERFKISDSNELLFEIDYFLNEDGNHEEIKNKVTDFYKSCEDFLLPSKKFRNVLCHGDLWINNTMYEIQTSKVIFVDYQNYRYTPPVQDVLYFIFISTNRSFRSKHLEKLIALYHQELRMILHDHHLDVEEILSYKEFLETCSYYKQFVLFQNVQSCSLTMMTPTQVEHVYQNSIDDFVYGDKTEVILKYCKEDAVYEERLKESIFELKECLFP